MRDYDDRPLPRAGGITISYALTYAARSAGWRVTGRVPQRHITEIESWHAGGMDHKRHGERTLCDAAAGRTQPGDPSEASCRRCLRIWRELPSGPDDCPGSAGSWAGGKSAPSCPTCGLSPSAMLVRGPRRTAAQLASLVPRHAAAGQA